MLQLKGLIVLTLGGDSTNWVITVEAYGQAEISDDTFNSKSNNNWEILLNLENDNNGVPLPMRSRSWFHMANIFS